MAPPPSKDKELVYDVGAWIFNVSTSVGIIMVNKQLLSIYGFNFASTLTGLHFLMTALMTFGLRACGFIQPTSLPLSELLKFALTANISIVGMNVSLMWNTVGFYQIAKLSMIPVSCLLEVMFDGVRYSRNTTLSILVVLAGVAVCTVTDVSVNSKGFIAAGIAIWSTAVQQYYVHFLQKKYRLGSFDLLAHTAPVQAGILILLGPAVDYLLSGIRVDKYDYSVPSVLCIVVSCAIAVGVNLSQFICIGRFTAVSFQVLGHMKTVLVLVLGFAFFGREGLNWQVIGGMAMAILGMIAYGNATSRPGSKEKVAIPVTQLISDPPGTAEEKLPLSSAVGGPQEGDDVEAP
eukprot:TRINITY_DN33236_c0_g1_i1.p1 TRINITY_DN33236_c0_g1~~TRINITY_DN33236_c0_g1_i1.p1  ORF type:complete len:348 (+),score=56.73 TRINITY_DN33236_c0_g1_i1:252-1295(+)